MALQVHWVKCGQPPTWCPFETVDLSNVTDEGVYVIWHGAPNPWTVRVGLGVIKARLEAHRKDPTILAYRQHGGLYVTWAVIEREQQEGVENYLADLLKPLVGEPLSQRLTDHGQFTVWIGAGALGAPHGGKQGSVHGDRASRMNHAWRGCEPESPGLRTD
jgi:hypothetical protein